MEIEVKGYSGCDVEIVREGKDLFVIKSTQDPKYAARLVLQGEKQRTAMLIDVPHIVVPKVHEILNANGKVAIKMDYVYSKNFMEFFENAGVHELDTFINAVLNFVDYEIEHSPIVHVDKSVFLAKVDEVEHKLLHRDKAIDWGGDYCEKVRNLISKIGEIEIPVGVCHGDLTLSNVLFSGSNYYLIDFLDSFVETPLQDIAKLRQDSKYLWSRLMYKNPYDVLRLKLISARIDAAIDEHYCHLAWYKSCYPLLQAINILRILPYAKENSVVDYLKTILDELV